MSTHKSHIQQCVTQKELKQQKEVDTAKRTRSADTHIPT